MGVDISATAAWGIKTTYGKIEDTYAVTREWIGPANGDRSFEFDPKSGKPNYKTNSAPPPELERWMDDGQPHVISGNYEPDATDECIIVLSDVFTDSHRSGSIDAKRIPTEPSSKKFGAFKEDMMKIGLWSEKQFGLWLYLDIS